MASGDTKTEALLRILGHGGSYDGISGSGNTKTQDLLVDAIGRIQNVEDDVEGLKNNPDVVDIVNTYADLQAYDTSTLTDKDIIRVLEDSTHDNDGSYYRYNASSQSFTYIGSAGGGGPTVVQTTGTSETDVMSQKAVTDTIFYGSNQNLRSVRIGNTSLIGTNSVVIGKASAPTRGDNIAIGDSAAVTNDSSNAYSVAIGRFATVSKPYATALGSGTDGGTGRSLVESSYGVALGSMARIEGTNKQYSVALGTYSKPTRAGEVNIGTGSNTYGYNSTTYRVLGGVHDPVDAHDAATKGYVDANAGGSVTFYLSVNPSVQANEITVYSDIDCTTPISLRTFISSIRDGKTVWLQYRNGSSEDDNLYAYQIVSAILTNVDTYEAYNEIEPRGYYYDYSGQRHYLSTYDVDPDATTGAFKISS